MSDYRFALLEQHGRSIAALQERLDANELLLKAVTTLLTEIRNAMKDPP